jgi:hypothetical protein
MSDAPPACIEHQSPVHKWRSGWTFRSANITLGNALDLRPGCPSTEPGPPRRVTLVVPDAAPGLQAKGARSRSEHPLDCTRTDAERSADLAILRKIADRPLFTFLMR